MDAERSLIDEFEDAIASKNVGHRADALFRIADLFEAASDCYTAEQITLFDDVMNRLIDQIDVSVRAAFGKRIADLPEAPPNTIRALAFDDAIEVAGPILTRSEQLDEATLIENARSKSQDHLLAISQRRVLAEAVTDVLVDRGNSQVALSTARNPGAKFSDFGYTKLVERSQEDRDLAAGVWSRPEIPRQHLLRLFAEASEAVRLKLEAADRSKASLAREMIARAAGQLQDKTRDQSTDYTAARAFVEALRNVGKLDETQLAQFARTGMFDATVVALSIMCDLPVSLIERMLVQGKAEQMLVLTKGTGLSWDTTKAVLLLKAGIAGSSTHEIEQCHGQFNKLHPETAKKAIQFYRLRGTASAPAQ